MEAVRKARKKIKFFTFARTDITLLFVIIILMAVGLVMVYSASYYESHRITGGATHFHFLYRQSIWVGLSLVVMVVVSIINYRWISRFAFFAYFISLFLLIFVLVSGAQSGRWIDLGFFRLQPSELSKFSVMLALAYSLDLTNKFLNKWRALVFNLGILIPPTLLAAMADLSTGIVIGVMGIAMILIAVPKWRAFFLYIVGGIFILGVGFFVFRDVVLYMLKDYQLLRIRIFLEGPWVDQRGAGYQTIQSLYAIGSGGVFGKGLGYSMQKNGFIPEAHNDIIFAVICEELGFFGALAVIALFVLLLWRCLVIANQTKQMLGVLMVAGVMTQVATQVVINISVVTNRMPATGMPLPFISYGGSSMLFLCMSLGVVLNIARHIYKGGRGS